MTEKRFYLNEGKVGILKILDLKEDNEAIYHTALKTDMKMVVELFNRLSEENEQLKEENKELQKENEQLKEKIARQKFSKKIMRENIKNYERAIKRLRKSYNEFDEMRLDRIRFLEKRLKKHGLSIYVNGCEDLE